MSSYWQNSQPKQYVNADSQAGANLKNIDWSTRTLEKLPEPLVTEPGKNSLILVFLCVRVCFFFDCPMDCVILHLLHSFRVYFSDFENADSLRMQLRVRVMESQSKVPAPWPTFDHVPDKIISNALKV